MLKQLSTGETSGRISGLGSAAGFVGGVLLLLIVYLGFIQGDGGTRGLLGVVAADGWNVRAAMLLAAAWFALFAWPLLVSVRTPAAVDRQVGGFLGAYRALWNEVKGEWRRDRNFVYYLVASAIFRDGLTGVFAFGAVLGVSVYGVSQADVLVFGVCASIVAAVGAALGGLLDDPSGLQTRHRRLAGRDDRRRTGASRSVRCAGVLDLRTAPVPVRRPHPGVRTGADAADCPRRARKAWRSGCTPLRGARRRSWPP